ncbi:hypothetical protein PPTG_07028 [Phytophthora nicotianae INRA-310]|uniref:Uncharacterized protein n=1 Tax=Phytophthora nicotianae (strain INRA-310) TaxID=761204 RepID=W2QRM7_PHYN3|nr:hypothetical protein PPTG_07028 [Phytophthora nicotianae INRA-310]ETN15837.1 hypothetical protein PPTG_07028 [Phytophthora nicotianae INRA-310]
MGPSAPPTTGCLVCKGSHWVKDCPTTNEDEKSTAIQSARDRRKERVERGKMVKDLIKSVNSCHKRIKNALDIPYCDADSSIISHTLVDKLLGLGGSMEAAALQPPVNVVVAGGAYMVCRSSVMLDLRIKTAAGPLSLHNVVCLVLDGDEEEFLLDRNSMQGIGIDIDRLFEQLADSDQVTDASANDAQSTTLDDV